MQFPNPMSKVKDPKTKLGIQFTIVAIIAFIVGTLFHSEIWHFFLGD